MIVFEVIIFLSFRILEVIFIIVSPSLRSYKGSTVINIDFL